MANLSTNQNSRRVRIVTQRAAFTMAFLLCVLLHQIMIWVGAVRREDSWGSVILNKLHWYIMTGLVGTIIGACLGYYLVTKWLASKPDDS